MDDLLKNAQEIGKVVFYEDGIESDEETYAAFCSFHAVQVLEHTEDDDYFVGIRANHFSIEIGYVEYAPKNSVSWSVDKPNFVLITANHKGTRISKLLEIKP